VEARSGAFGNKEESIKNCVRARNGMSAWFPFNWHYFS